MDCTFARPRDGLDKKKFHLVIETIVYSLHEIEACHEPSPIPTKTQRIPNQNRAVANHNRNNRKQEDLGVRKEGQCSVS